MSPPPARTSTESRENGIAGPHPGDAAVDRENVRHPSSNDSSNVSTSRQSIGSQSQPWRPSPLLCSEARDPSSHFSSSTSDKTSRAESGLPTHDWEQEDPYVVEAIFSGVSPLKFEPLLAYLGDDSIPRGRRKDRIPLLESTYGKWRQEKLQARNTILTASLSDELPPAATVYSLVKRYFETLHTILPVLDQTTFTAELDRLLADPSNAPMYLLVQVLLILALANGTYPLRAAPIPQTSVQVWCDLASSVPTTALELGECSIDILRVAALLNTAKHTLKFNDTADYVYSGAGARLAMMMGLNRTSETDAQTRQLWDTVRELDLHACLACGAAPTVPPGTDLICSTRNPSSAAQGPVRDKSLNGGKIDNPPSENPLEILRQSLGIRTKIVVLMNDEEHLRFEDAMHLSRELAQYMSASDTTKASGSQKSFADKYVEYIYHKYLVALHRPFATFDEPAFYLSRDISRHRAQRHLQNVCASYRDGSSADAFGAMLVGNGTMFRVAVIQSALWLSFELYRSETYDTYMSIAGSSSGWNRPVSIEVLGEVIEFAEQGLRRGELAGLAYLIPSLVLQHAASQKVGSIGSDGYNTSMIRACKDMRDKFINSFA